MKPGEKCYIGETQFVAEKPEDWNYGCNDCVAQDNHDLCMSLPTCSQQLNGESIIFKLVEDE